MSLLVFETISSLRTWLEKQKKSGKTLGFVPTMGALHPGHVSLVKTSNQNCDLTVVSIFVNPTQFNNQSDLLHYPITIEADKEMLEAAGCDAVFIPAVSEMYPKAEKGHWDFGTLSHTLEGEFRPGHFDGVLTIVKKLFEIVRPDKAFFGEKDFQQLAHIKRLVDVENMPVEIVACPTTRETDGLAMSSRNRRLSPEQRFQALAISRVLFAMRENPEHLIPAQLLEKSKKELENSPGIRLEYLNIIDGYTFETMADFSESDMPVAVVAAYVGDVRLIDNIRLS